jgi:hypothetical protein
MADDDDNRSYINRSWNHLVTHVTLRSVNIVVPDEMIPAKQNSASMSGSYGDFTNV